MELVQVCICCGKTKELEKDYYKHSLMSNGHLGKCKECCKNNTHINYRKNIKHYVAYNKERQQEQERKSKKLKYQTNRRTLHPEKYKANCAVSNAIRDGRLKKQPCEMCGNEKAQAHHKDYSKPLDVTWLCFPCHLYRHRKNKI